MTNNNNNSNLKYLKYHIIPLPCVNFLLDQALVKSLDVGKNYSSFIRGYNEFTKSFI